MSKSLRILIVEDSPDDADLLCRKLKNSGYEIISLRVENAEGMRQALAQGGWEIVISDYSMPNFSGMDALAILKATNMDIPFIMVSGSVGEETAINAMKAGASDYVMKDSIARLVPAIERELRDSAMRVSLKEKEEQLRQAQKMEVIGQLAGGIAHDYNNVLAVILMYCDMLLKKNSDQGPTRSYVEQIKKSGERAAGLTRQLLAFSRKQILEPIILDLNQVIANMESMLDTLTGDHIQLTTEFGHGLGRVKVDPGQMEQVIMNLAVNARDAMAMGGSIFVKTENVVLEENSPLVSFSKPGRYVTISIKDTGIGMDAQTKTRIFEPFFSSKGNKGTGLGLSTVYGIVNQSKGYISVESQLGKGTTFKIYLPHLDLPADPVHSPVTSWSASDQEKGTILLLEDDNDLRNILAECLEEKGYTVISPDEPSDAVEKVKTYGKKIDLLVTDVVMPKLSGPELAARLSIILPKMKILFISGYLDDTLEAFDLVKDKASFLQKPFAVETLLKKVQEILRGKS